MKMIVCVLCFGILRNSGLWMFILVIGWMISVSCFILVVFLMRRCRIWVIFVVCSLSFMFLMIFI